MRMDGWAPASGLLNLGGTLYGTTIYGNAHSDNGANGTVFALTRE
jgi:hypothetical protein